MLNADTLSQLRRLKSDIEEQSLHNCIIYGGR